MESVEVHFYVQDEKRNLFDVNSYIPFTAEEYAGNDLGTSLTG
ncbi:hypothetical protein [Bacillus sp. ISL-35]|nr:hypothetical protein [Bacillus sp. ISL-35]